MVLLQEIIIILLLAIVIIVITSKLNIPPILGFLFTGILIGPSALKLVKDATDIEVLAEIGVIILMFSIGLEFSFSKIKAMKKAFLQLGFTQVMLSWIVFYIILFLMNYPFNQAFFISFILALSSTAIVFKLLQEKDELNTPSGLNATGILLFQDAAIIPFILLLPAVLQFEGQFSLNLVLKILGSIAGVAVLFGLSRYLIPKFFYMITRIKIPELLMVSVIVFLFGTSFLTHLLGASMAMGGFIAGVAISDSEIAHQVNTDMIPSRHIFNSIFFISIGMFINLLFLYENIQLILLLTSLLIVIKLIIIFGIVVVVKKPVDQALFTAFSLAHIGEFSFVLLTLAKDHQVLPSETEQLILSIAVLSMFSIPFSMKIGRTLAGHKRFKKKIAADTPDESLNGHTIIAGYGVNGQNISKVLKLLGIPYVIFDLNNDTVRRFKQAGEPIHFADISRKENLDMIRIEKASLMIMAISDMDAAKKAIRAVRSQNPNIKIIARSNFLTQVEEIYLLGADLVLSQDMETSLVFVQHILKFYHMPDHIVRIQTNLLRKKHYQFFIKKQMRDSWKVAIFENVEQDNEMFFIGPKSTHVGRKLSELEPFGSEGLKFIGVIRHDKVISDDLESVELEPFDTLILGGIHDQVYSALIWLEDNN